MILSVWGDRIRDDGNVVGLEEKPSVPKSQYAAIGLYIYHEAVSVARC